MIVIGLALFFFITIVSIESENLFEFPVYVLDILALVSLGLIFVGLGLNIIFAFNIKPKRKSFLEVVRHSASALWALTFILIYGYRTYSHLSPNPKIPHILYKYSSELGIVFILLAGIGYYISSIWDHENLGSENHDGLIEEIGA